MMLVLPLWAALAVAQPPDVTFRASAQEVALDLVVRDKHGKLVKNLKPEDVEIYENGVRQELKGFRLVPGREVARVQETQTRQTKQRAFARPGAAQALPPVNLVCIVFHNLDPDPNRIQNTTNAVQAFLDHGLQPGTGVAFFNLATQLTLLRQFTTNRDELKRTMANLLDASVPRVSRIADAVLSAAPYSATVLVTPTGETSMQVGGGEVNLQAITGPEIGMSQGQMVYRGLLADQRRAFGYIDAARMWDQMKLMITELGPLPGRKSVLLFSTGLTNTGDPEMYKRLEELANQAQITIYAIDVSGLTQNSNLLAGANSLNRTAALSRGQSAALTSAGRSMELARQGEEMNMAVRNSDPQASLRALAENTGGFLIANTEEFGKQFQRVMEEVDTRYEASYRPASNQYDGQFRSIEVKLKRADLNVQHRAGYFALPAHVAAEDPTVFDMIGLAALSAKQRPRAFDVQLASYQFRPTPKGSQRVLALEVPAGAVSATAIPERNQFHVHLAALALIKDASGQVVDKVTKEVSFYPPHDKLESLRQTRIPLALPVDLAPGKYTVEAAVIDVEGSKTTTTTLEFESRPQPGVGLSSILLVQSMETLSAQADAGDPLQFPLNATQSRRVTPGLNTRLAPDAKPVAYFVVYPDKANAAKPKIEVEFLAGGASIAKQTVDLPAPNETGAIPMVLRGPAQAGDCEVRITAMQGAATATRTLAYHIAAQ